jgi:hypothetical protein
VIAIITAIDTHNIELGLGLKSGDANTRNPIMLCQNFIPAEIVYSSSTLLLYYTLYQFSFIFISTQRYLYIIYIISLYYPGRYLLHLHRSDETREMA